MNKKGFIFTIDAILALILAITLVGMIYFNFSQHDQQPYAENDLFQVSADSLTMLEKKNDLQTALEQNTLTTMQTFVDGLPSPYCANITFKTNNAYYVSSVQNTCNISTTFAFARRAFIANDSVFFAVMQTWYR